jgi:hypothetical protein
MGRKTFCFKQKQNKKNKKKKTKKNKKPTNINKQTSAET